MYTILLWSWNDKWIDFYLEIIDLFNYLLLLEAQTSTCFNNLEGKITECWLVNEEGIFFLNFACEEGKITCSRLVLRLPSNSLCYQVVVAKKLSVTMASCFEIVDEEYIEELKDNSENENTKKSTDYWKNVFKKWANETQI